MHRLGQKFSHCQLEVDCVEDTIRKTELRETENKMAQGTR